MKWSAGLPLLLGLLVGCDGHFRALWHGETLASGDTVKVTSFDLVWGAEHDGRDARKDCFAMEYVTAHPGKDLALREAEAKQVFNELVRPAAERWGFRTAEVSAFPHLERKGHYDFYAFEQAADGRWSFKRSGRKVFSTD